MERIIITSLYFDSDAPVFGKQQDASPATEVTFAWLPNKGLENIPDILEETRITPNRINIELGEFLDEIIEKGYYSFQISNPFRAPRNPLLITRIIEEPIIIERSPPQAISIRDLLSLSASPTALGTYVGINVASGHYLLLLTVPAGILVVGAAIEITKALPMLLGISEAVKPRPRSSRKRDTPPKAKSA